MFTPGTEQHICSHLGSHHPNQLTRPTTHVPHVPYTTPYAREVHGRTFHQLDFTAPFTPYAWAWAGLHSFARTLTAVTVDPDRVRGCRLVRLHALNEPDTEEATARFRGRVLSSFWVRTNSTSRRVVLGLSHPLSIACIKPAPTS